MHELAKTLGITSTELIEKKANDLGMRHNKSYEYNKRWTNRFN